MGRGGSRGLTGHRGGIGRIKVYFGGAVCEEADT